MAIKHFDTSKHDLHHKASTLNFHEMVNSTNGDEISDIIIDWILQTFHKFGKLSIVFCYFKIHSIAIILLTENK